MDNHCIRKISTDGIVTTIAGQPRVKGFRDGRENLWNYPYGLTVGQDRELFVTDWNHAVRRISLDDLTVVTIAGGKQQGHFDGQGGEAKFEYNEGIAQLSNKDLIVADVNNQVLRQITPDGHVTTIAGISFFFCLDLLFGV